MLPIVRTNLLRETMNIQKAHTNSFKHNLALTNCAATDSCSSSPLTGVQLHHLLTLDMSSSKIKDSLPGYIPLYIGMPIVLKNKNISTDLGIMNGCQGFIRDLHIENPTGDLCHCICAIIEFPHSKVCLSGMPKGYFPIMPVKTSFITYLTSNSGEKIKTKINRSQLPIQPAFAVTGHCAQGKTLPHVLTNLQEGGFAAYVAASRPRSRHGLFLTEAVTLQDLNNKPLPYSLLQETNWLNAIEHNTYVRHGFRHGNYQEVPDPESERQFTSTNINTTFHTSPSISSSHLSKDPNHTRRPSSRRLQVKRKLTEDRDDSTPSPLKSPSSFSLT
jgi:hypothetical protein